MIAGFQNMKSIEIWHVAIRAGFGGGRKNASRLVTGIRCHIQVRALFSSTGRAVGEV